MKLSRNLHAIPKLSFTPEQCSQFHIKKQPAKECLSTIESVDLLLKILQKQHIEDIPKEASLHFLKPFKQMVAYQLDKAQKERNIRYK